MGTVGYLLDTHTFLWATLCSHKLGDATKKVIDDETARFFVSAVSAYEIMNKYRIGKLSEFEYVAKNYFDVLKQSGAIELSITTQHTHFAGKFEWSHRDPFDRLLAAQASTEKLTLITNDPAFETLPWVETLW